MTAIGATTLIPVIELRSWIAGCGDAELVGAKTELCDVVDNEELVGLEEELVRIEEELVRIEEVLPRLEGGGLVVPKEDGLVAVIDTEVVSASDCPDCPDCVDLSIAENGYGSSEVVRLVSQQSGPPGLCPAAPPQHQLLSWGPQRLTSVKPPNWSLNYYL